MANISVRVCEGDGSRAFEISAERCRRLLRLAGADERRLDPLQQEYLEAAMRALGGLDALLELDSILRRAEQLPRPKVVKYLHDTTVAGTRVRVEAVDSEGNLQTARRDSVLHDLSDEQLADLLLETMLQIEGSKRTLLEHRGFRAPPAPARRPDRPIGFGPWSRH
jgi:hypothetical protein